MHTLKAWWARLQATHAWQAWKRYGDARGNVLAGGVGWLIQHGGHSATTASSG